VVLRHLQKRLLHYQDLEFGSRNHQNNMADIEALPLEIVIAYAYKRCMISSSGSLWDILCSQQFHCCTVFILQYVIFMAVIQRPLMEETWN
jgi:hypothetical protein